MRRSFFALVLMLAMPIVASAQATDAFQTAPAIDLAGGMLTGSTAAATAQPGEVGFSALSSKSVWVRFNATERTRFNAKTEGSDFDTTLALYRGANVSEARLIAGNDDSPVPQALWSAIDVTVTPGTYWLAIDGFGTASGNYVLSWQTVLTPLVLAFPPGDNFANAVTLNPDDLGALSFVNNTVSTLEAGEPGGGTRSVWYKFTAPKTQPLRIRTLDMQFDSRVDVYTGSTLVNLASVASNDDVDFGNGNLESEVSFAATQGTLYYVRVAAVSNGNGGGKLVLAPAKTQALPGLDASYGGTWWNPTRDGEGVLIEIADHPDPASNDLFLFFTWYTYDPTGNPVYLAGGVARSPQALIAAPITIPVVTTRGGRFGAEFNPATVVRQPWGSVTLAYRNCGKLDITYTPTVTGWGEASTIRFERTLSRASGFTCP